MPFDGATFVLSEQEVLESAMSASGLEPIDLYRLYRHKAEQIRRNPPGWAYRHQHAVALAQVAMLLGSVGLFVVLLSAQEIPWGFVAGLAVFGLGSSVLLVPVKGPAQWRERVVQDLRDVPPAIRESAERLRRRLPRVGFVVGELFQDRIKLDPYLIAEYGHARVVLGIWDGDEVIACAEMPAGLRNTSPPKV
jgi:hypothetical protein